MTPRLTAEQLAAPDGVEPRPAARKSREAVPEPGGYASATSQYAALGWGTIPVLGKTPPPSGATGRAGTVTDEKRAEWSRDRKWRDSNIAIRHDGTIAIDVDEHDDKHGARQLGDWVSRFGILPRTFSSTARADSAPESRQYIYRVPPGTRLISGGENVEICQHDHRYSMVWPSVHPETGEQYRWFGSDGSPLDGPPAVEDIPFLPDRWLEGLAADRAANRATERRTTAPRRSLAELLADPPARGDGQTNDWLTQVAGHFARQHRDRRDLYETKVREAAARVDPDYEDTEKTLESVWRGDVQRNPSRVRPQALDDSTLVDSMADAFRLLICWSGGHGWREWDGKVWESRTDAYVVERVRLAMQDLYHRESAATTDSKRASALGQLLSGGKVRGVTGLLRGALEVESTAFDSHPDLLNCNNGMVDLRSGELRPHDPRMFMTKVTTTDYVPGATHPDWDKALGAIPEDVRPFMQVRMGQAATGYRVTDELMPVLYGGGKNGKTTFLSSVQSALGSHARSVSDRVLTARDTDHPTELTDLQGLRLAVIEELPEAVPLSVKRLKDTVGQPTITARKIAKDTVTWETSHALLLATNHKPRVNETDHGTWRRLALVRFPFVFDGKDGADHKPGDPGLHDRMRRGVEGRREAVLAWIVEGAHRWYRSGQVFPPIPERVTRDTEEWRGESDVIVSYLTDRIRFDSQTAVGTTDLLHDLNAWLDAHGKAAWGDQLLTERFGTHERVTGQGVEKKRVRVASSGVQVVGRDGRPLARQPEGQARLWLGVAFSADGETTEGIPW
ncbi:phage/plasmid primase, P4 family [Leifsonia bigeumensis]|uniref:Phage/plasmid primase, P4 family n=1 Tax=Leifsonella bigeumensis TaxID=433643 RepID=A0ABP7FEB1_9MICO